MFAYIPARGGSKRIPRKNLRLLDGKPVLARVIDNIRELDFIDHVFVSTDDPEIAEMAESCGALTLGPRAAELSTDQAGFIELIRGDLPRFKKYCADDDKVLFVLATAALVPSGVFRAAYEVWQEHRPEVLMSCEKSFPWWSMIQKDDGYWTPLFPDRVLVNSQDQPSSLVDAGLFYFFSQSVAATYTSLKLVDRLLPYVVEDRYNGDIDTLEDWNLLEAKYWKLAGECR